MKIDTALVLAAASAATLGEAAEISVSPLFPNETYANITVSWTGVDSPAADDWIGAYCPFQNDTTAFITYIEVGTGAPYGKPYPYGPYIPYVNSSASTWADGHGNVTFSLPDIRCNYEFLYLRRSAEQNGTSTSTVIAQGADPVTFKFGQPIGVHLAYTHDPTEMRVSWNSGSTALPIVSYRPRGSNALFQAQGGTTQTYSADDLCGSEAAEVQPQNFIDPGYFHTAVMTGLKPGTEYEYYVVQNDSPQSPTYAFRSAPTPDDPVAFLMWADMGSNQYNSYDHYGDVDRALDLITQVSNNEAIIDTPTAAANADAVPVGLVTHVGDLSYGCGNGFIWEQWQQLIQPVATRVPYMVAVGNHEYDHEQNSTAPGRHNVDISGVEGPSFHPVWGDYADDSFGECGVTTAMRFTMPQAKSKDMAPSNGVFWYSFDHGPVHFTVWSSEHNFTKGSRQFEWIVQDVNAVNRTLTPWLVVQMHRPMYASEAQDGGSDLHLQVAQQIRDNLEDVFDAANVDMVMTGHLHSYERTCAVLKNGTECNATDGIVNLRVGTAGGPSDNCKATDPLCPNNDTMYFLPNITWREVGIYDYGYSRVTVPNRSALHVEFILNNGTVRDETWLKK